MADATFGSADRPLVKFNPLADWSEEDVWHYIRSNNVPYNPLHDRGYPSIGCEPCTRAIQPGEDVRAGRWWWENPESKECGLHVVDRGPEISGGRGGAHDCGPMPSRNAVVDRSGSIEKSS